MGLRQRLAESGGDQVPGKRNVRESKLSRDCVTICSAPFAVSGWRAFILPIFEMEVEVDRAEIKSG
jgi:hypothetical protein